MKWHIVRIVLLYVALFHRVGLRRGGKRQSCISRISSRFIFPGRTQVKGNIKCKIWKWCLERCQLFCLYFYFLSRVEIIINDNKGSWGNWNWCLPTTLFLVRRNVSSHGLAGVSSLLLAHQGQSRARERMLDSTPHYWVLLRFTLRNVPGKILAVVKCNFPCSHVSMEQLSSRLSYYISLTLLSISPSEYAIYWGPLFSL